MYKKKFGSIWWKQMSNFNWTNPFERIEYETKSKRATFKMSCIRIEIRFAMEFLDETTFEHGNKLWERISYSVKRISLRYDKMR